MNPRCRLRLDWLARSACPSMNWRPAQRERQREECEAAGRVRGRKDARRTRFSNGIAEIMNPILDSLAARMSISYH